MDNILSRFLSVSILKRENLPQKNVPKNITTCVFRSSATNSLIAVKCVFRFSLCLFSMFRYVLLWNKDLFKKKFCSF